MPDNSPCTIASCLRYESHRCKLLFKPHNAAVVVVDAVVKGQLNVAVSVDKITVVRVDCTVRVDDGGRILVVRVRDRVRVQVTVTVDVVAVCTVVTLVLVTLVGGHESELNVKIVVDRSITVTVEDAEKRIVEV